MDNGILFTLVTWAIPLIIAIIFHEYGHVFAVRRLSREGSADKSLSYNPISFVDPLGTVILPLMLVLTRSPFFFGWARTLYRGDSLSNPKRDHVLIAAAGPLANLLLALIAAVTLRFVGSDTWMAAPLLALIFVNVFLAVLNFLPLPGFDGFTVVSGLLPDPMGQNLAQLNKFALPILLVIFIALPSLVPGLNFVEKVVYPLLNPMMNLFRSIAQIAPV